MIGKITNKYDYNCQGECLADIILADAGNYISNTKYGYRTGLPMNLEEKRLSNRVSSRKYYRNNREQRIKKTREYYNNNREKIKAYMREYYLKNKPKKEKTNDI